MFSQQWAEIFHPTTIITQTNKTFTQPKIESIQTKQSAVQQLVYLTNYTNSSSFCGRKVWVHLMEWRVFKLKHFRCEHWNELRFIRNIYFIAIYELGPPREDVNQIAMTIYFAYTFQVIKPTQRFILMS